MTDNKISIGKDNNAPIVIGDKNTVTSKVSVQQSTPDLPMDLAALADQLVRLRDAMKAAAVSSDELRSTAEIADAEKAARSGNKEGFWLRLKAAGKWALEIAEKIGVNVIADVIKKALSMP